MNKNRWILLLWPFVASCATPTQMNLDAEVRRLCAIDGGVRVYETVSISPENFDQKGSVKFFRPSRGEYALGPDYVFKEEKHYYKKGEYEKPAMWRIRTQILRRSDMKLLGEAVTYTRRGGDMPGPWHPSNFTCPELKDINLLERLFVSQQKVEER
jgi:hypothetical protein